MDPNYLAFKIDPTSFPGARITGIPQLVNLGLPIAITVGGLVFLFTLLYSGFTIITHGDNPEALKKAYSSMVYAVIGLFIVVTSFMVVRLIGGMTGAF